MRRFLENIELWLSGAGLLVVWAAAVLVAPGNADVWQVAAVTALAVSVLHGFIFWAVRRRQRRLRNEAIHEIREMLADTVKNQLAVIGLWLQTGDPDSDFEVQLEGINDSIDKISSMVDGLSEESLRSWKLRYEAEEERGAQVPAAL